MNGKYYGKREIRWHSREKERLEHIHKKGNNNVSQKNVLSKTDRRRFISKSILSVAKNV